jgi:hypothetical protein
VKIKFKNTEIDVYRLRQGTLVFSENLNKFYYIEGFKYLNDNNPILHVKPVEGGTTYCISSCLLVWLEGP